MMEKIAWYQEVLEQDPASRVFFPLARLLCDDNRRSEAVAALKSGLIRHPDFLEARLFLIQILSDTEQVNESLIEAVKVSKILEAYPAFLDAWAQTAANKELEVVIRLLGVLFRYPAATLSDILELGLNKLAQKEDSPPNEDMEDCPVLEDISQLPIPEFLEDEPDLEIENPSEHNTMPTLDIPDIDLPMMDISEMDMSSIDTPAEKTSPTDISDIDLPPMDISEMDTSDMDLPMMDLPMMDIPEAELPLMDGPEVELLPADTPHDDPLPVPEEDLLPDEILEDTAPFTLLSKDLEDSELITLRTRSMAEVLAEQGDVAGALEIYQELEAAAPTPEEARILHDRVLALAARVGVELVAPKATSQPVAWQSRGAQSAGSQSGASQSIGSQPAEPQPTEPQPAEHHLAESHLAESHLAEPQPTMPQPTTHQSTEPQPLAPSDAPEPCDPAPQDNLKSLLESLATRLEARARA